MAVGTKPAELRELSDPELVERLREAKAELFNLRVQNADRAAGQPPAAAGGAAGDRPHLHHHPGT